jgi:hypothetical protein
MYAKLCDIEILSSYIKDVSVGDMLTVSALVTNPLDWQHFYEKISTIRQGERTDFTVVTREGDRLVGSGDIVELDKWSNRGSYGFKLKINVKKQKSLTDRRTREKPRVVAVEKERVERPEVVPAAPAVSAQDMNDFKELLKGSIAMDMSA